MSIDKYKRPSSETFRWEQVLRREEPWQQRVQKPTNSGLAFKDPIDPYTIMIKVFKTNDVSVPDALVRSMTKETLRDVFKRCAKTS